AGPPVIRRTGNGSVTRITTSRAGRKTAVDAELIRAVTAAAREVERTTRVVVLQSEGDTFCAGADLEWMRGMAGFTLEENRADSRALAEMYRSLYELEMPLVARVQGAAIGGAGGLVAAAASAVASSGASFALSEPCLGSL